MAYDAKITAKKGIMYTALAGVVDFLVQYVSTAQIDVLDMSLRALIIGGLVAFYNWYKHHKD